MPSAQPLNTTISVFRRLRSYKDNRRHTSIKHLTTPFETDLVSVPGEEVLVTETRDANITDAFRFGHPVVIAPRSPATLAEIYAGVAGLDFPVRLPGNPREVQIQNTSSNVTNDLYGDAQAVQAGLAFTV